ncbi:MAG: AMP-binding protein [Methanomicrobiaceae archaeon]|nr:AMP-binding protein [Methanomicrobiaceae archaeon]
MTNFTAFLDINARFEDKPALVHPTSGRSCTYRELLAETMHVASGLAALGISKGDRVCIYLDSSPEYLISFCAVWRAGAIAVPLNIALRKGEVRYHVDDAGAKALITSKQGWETARGACSRTATLSSVIIVDGDIKGTIRWSSLGEQGVTVPPVHCDCNDLCQLQYTSGTTGKPKGAMLTHGNWMAAMDAERDVLDLCKEDVYLGIYPMAHVGVSWGIAVLKAGGTWVIMERFDLDRYLDLVESTKATVVAGMPPVIHSLLETPPGTEEKFASARLMISGGGPLHPHVWKAFHTRFGTPIVNAYGLSETIVVGTGTAIRPEDYETADEFRSVGKPVGYSEVTIVDLNDPSVSLPAGEVGEIALRGPAVARGYWNMPGATRDVFLPDGWFLTGDIGYIDADGMLAITDRKKDMIVMSGWKIYPTEVEKVLIEHPGIRDVAIFGIPDLHRGEIPVAAVVPEKGCIISPEDLMAFGKARLAGYKVPRKVVILDELPRVHGWKLLRRDLRDRFREA